MSTVLLYCVELLSSWGVRMHLLCRSVNTSDAHKHRSVCATVLWRRPMAHAAIQHVRDVLPDQRSRPVARQRAVLPALLQHHRRDASREQQRRRVLQAQLLLRTVLLGKLTGAGKPHDWALFGTILRQRCCVSVFSTVLYAVKEDYGLSWGSTPWTVAWKAQGCEGTQNTGLSF